MVERSVEVNVHYIGYNTPLLISRFRFDVLIKFSQHWIAC